MKQIQIATLFLVTWSWMHSPVCAQQIPVFELHASVNHPLNWSSENDSWSSAPEVRTFYGGGLGANVVFADASTASFKTGLEVNFFHTWNESVYTGHTTGKSNVHYRFWNLSIPAMLRIHVGKRVRFFLDAGFYLGIPLTGRMTSNYHAYPTAPGEVGVNEVREEKFEGYFSLTPAISLGGIFPVSKRIDLFVKPEFLFQKNFGVYDTPVSDFNEKFSYLRLCSGIRINLNEIE